MQRAIVTVSGDVQRVGYRDAVEAIARKLGITGFVENLKPYNVRIIAEGEKLKDFIDKIVINKYPIFVEKIDVIYEKPTCEFEYFEIKRGDWRDEIGERLDTAGTLLYRNIELSEQSVVIGRTMLEKQDKMLDKQDKMLEKQDETINILKGIDKKQDMMLEKQDKTIEVIGTRFNDMDRKYGDMSHTMCAIDKKLDKLTTLFEKLVNHFVKE